MQAPVGFQCPECLADGRAQAAASQRVHQQRVRASQGGPVKRFLTRWLGLPSPMTVAIVAVTAAAGIGQILLGGIVMQALAFYGPYAVFEPWRLLTVVLVHGSLLHFVFNMLCLYMMGPGIEERIGKSAFLVAYLGAAAAGCVAAAVLNPTTALVGASGGIFGFFGVYIGLQRMLGNRVNPQLLIIVGVNLLIGLVMTGVSWQAHVGGLLFGLALGFWMGAGLRRSGSKGTRAAIWVPTATLTAAVFAAWGAAAFLIY